MKKRILSGIKPTGTPHIGNYAGMLRPFINNIRTSENESLIFIPDYHALNNPNARRNLNQLSHELAATLISVGFNPDECIFFRQSDVPEHFELMCFLMNFTPKGLMNRAHAYKAIVQDTPEGEDPDIGVNMGVYNYPMLMTADILLYDIDIVPVGRDQRQHIEFARDIAGSVNAFYNTDVFKLPEASLEESVMELPGFDGRKMSKSYGNIIPLFTEEDELVKLYKRVKTDSKAPEEPKSKDNLIYQLYMAIATPEQLADFEKRFLGGGLGYGKAKEELAHIHVQNFKNARESYHNLLKDPTIIDRILENGAAKAREIATPVLKRVKKTAGFF